MCVVTTSQVVNAVLAKDPEEASRRVGDGVFAATSLGFVASLIFLSPLGGMLVAAFTSSGGGRSALYFPITLGYVRVRALGLIPALAGAVYQSACLSRHNIRLPLLSVACAGIANLILDCILVLGLGQGAIGAAWASVAAQVAAFAVLMKHENSLHPKKSGVPTRDLSERCSSLVEYLKECVSPASALAGKSVVIMSVMSTASGCGPVALAAHQVCQSVFCLFSPFGEALSQTAQAILPQVNIPFSAQATASLSKPDASPEVKTRRTDRRRMTAQAKRLVASLTGASAGLGAVNAVFAGCIPLLAAGLFTSDLRVAALMAGVAPWMMGILLFHAMAMLLEGALFGTGDGDFLGQLYPVNSVIMCSIFWFLRRTQRVSLPALWATMLGYNITRFIQFGCRLAYNQRRTPLVDKLSAPEEVSGTPVEIPAMVLDGLDLLSEPATSGTDCANVLSNSGAALGVFTSELAL